MTIEIPLTRGYVALIDDEDYRLVQPYSWYPAHDGNRIYAVGKVPGIGRNKRASVLMHRLITDAKPNVPVDHINQAGLDNRRSNLRSCTDTENQRNRGRQCNNKSGYKGVSQNKRRGKWEARIKANSRYYFLGYFNDPIEAAYAYDLAAIRYHGDYAYLNFREGVEGG